MKKTGMIIVGSVALLLTMGLNVSHALNDYGIKSNSLSSEILAQAITSGSSSGKTTGGATGTGGTSSDGGIWDGITSWWNEKTHKCVTVKMLKYGFVRYGDLKEDGQELLWGIGQEPDDDEIVWAAYEEESTDCVGGDEVAHCWECDD